MFGGDGKLVDRSDFSILGFFSILCVSAPALSIQKDLSVDMCARNFRFFSFSFFSST